MTHNTHSNRRRPLVAVALAALASLGACSDSDDARQAVLEANRSFTGVAAGDTTAARPYIEETYAQTEELLQQHAGGHSGYAEAAAVSLALSRLGQASLASQDASDAEAAALQRARIIRGMISEWLTMTAIAQAAGKFDPSAEVEEINSIVETRREDIARYRERREQIESEMARYRQQIDELRAKAQHERAAAGELELQMPRVSATQAAEIAQRVREHTLRADHFGLEALRIEGIADQHRPRVREAQLNVERAQSQIELLEQAIGELRDRAQASETDARQARQDAQAAAERIRQAVEEYTALRENEVNSANERAAALARNALTALRDANDATRQVASLTKASIEQTLAGIYAREAGGYGEEALLYLSLDETGLSGKWQPMIESARQQQQQARQSSNQAFLGAAAALRAARIRGDVAPRIEATAARLEALGGVTPEPEEPLEDEMTEQPEPDEDQTHPAEEQDPALEDAEG